MDRQKKGPGIRRSMSFSHGNLNKHVRNISKLRRNINFDRINISCGLIINYYSRSVWSIISLPTKNTTAATTRGDEDQVMKNISTTSTWIVNILFLSRCMVNRGRQLPEPKPVSRSQSFLRKLRGKDSGKPEVPIRNVVIFCFEIVPTTIIHIYLSSSRKFFL